MPNLKAKEYRQFEDIISTLEKMEVSIGVQENLLLYLIILSGETFKR